MNQIPIELLTVSRKIANKSDDLLKKKNHKQWQIILGINKEKNILLMQWKMMVQINKRL